MSTADTGTRGDIFHHGIRRTFVLKDPGQQSAMRTGRSRDSLAHAPGLAGLILRKEPIRARLLMTSLSVLKRSCLPGRFQPGIVELLQ